MLSEYVSKVDVTKLNKLSTIALLRYCSPYRKGIADYARLLKYAKYELNSSDAELRGLDT